MAHYGSGIYGLGVYGAESALTGTVQDTYPERVLLSATNLVDDQVVSITRRVAGSTIRTPVRGGDEIDGAVATLVRADAEAPMGVELTYTLTIDGVDNDTVVVTLTLPGGRVALSDAISGESAEVTILEWPEKRRSRNSSVYAVGGRNIVVAGQRGGFEGSIELFTETIDNFNNLIELLDTATSGILQLRQPGPYDGVDCYISVLADTETRWSSDGTDDRRIVSLDVVEVGPWAPGLESSTFTLQDIANTYTGLTLLDLAADFTTLLELAQGDFN